MSLKRSFLWLSVFALSMLAAGCANKPKTIYGWADYQGQVYAHFKAQKTGPEEQLASMEKGLERIKSQGATPPPGYYAHMGLLYLNVGKDDLALNSWQEEKRVYPESVKYIDFLLSKKQK